MGTKKNDAPKSRLDSLEEASFRAGESLQQVIDSAIRNGDYSSLSRQISDVVNKAVDAVQEGLSNAVFGNGSGSGDKIYTESSAPAGADIPYWQREETRTYRSSTPSAYKAASSKGLLGPEFMEAKDYLTGAGGVISPVAVYIKEILQIIGAAISGLMLVGSLAAGPGGGMWAFSIFFAFISALQAVFAFKNHKKISRIKMGRKLLKLMGNKGYITVDEVSAAFGMDEQKVSEELKGMIQDHIFTGPAYMDRQGTTFMTSQDVYRQYQNLEKSQGEGYEKGRGRRKTGASSAMDPSKLTEYNKMKDEKQERERKEEAANAKYDRETAQILAEGRAFIKHIHEKNDEIPGEDFSEKLYRLESIVTNIFDRVAAAPESAPDLHRMMKYYLPTTQKLVDTYATLDGQNFSGENVDNAKREIERSLDTINSAFEKLLDQFFQETAWDVSSDISVMGTMMAQDGLMGGDDFSRSQDKPAEGTGAFGYDKGYTEGYTEGYSDNLSSGMAYAQAPDRQDNGR